MRLNKRRKIGGNVGATSLKTKLLVKHREFNDTEFKAQADRLSMLEQEIDDDDISEADDNQIAAAGLGESRELTRLDNR